MSDPDREPSFSDDAGPRDRILTVLEDPQMHVGESPVDLEQLQAAVKLSDAVFETALKQLVQNGRVRYIPSEGYVSVGNTGSDSRRCAICSDPIDVDSYTEISIETHRPDATVASNYTVHRSCATPILDLVDEFDYLHRE